MPCVSQPALKPSKNKRRRLPLAALALAGTALPAAAELPAARDAINTRVAAVRAALTPPGAASRATQDPAGASLLAQASNWTNWPKWSKWSNWANK